ncbi:Nuclear Hormone Receptor family [Caenorhabditis elegans]|uniref:Nuclear Hormone Receptor family n=1 Tax=Caenorhabditis elegans TaxID=6239 RepID=Q17929_CAEEL|nr:Nuclear Hormone Receptor family [Caenorhabditis elegans]CCD64270.1 Nuclear Hormone Receptor family [Caenorhabditis elegans]|eukprot:NP_504990.2 Nuclear Hormone Receptor family [Caenorhabditis elegans]
MDFLHQVANNSILKFPSPFNCKICNRPAHGHHCDVATCKGCKTFFRRMYLLKSELRCYINSDCFDLDKRTEPLLRCRACRFKKCLLVGMNPNALNFRTTKNLTQSLKNSKEEKIKDVINELTYLDCKLEQFRLSAYNPNWTEIGGLEDLLRCSSKLSLSNKFGPFPGWPYHPNHIFASSNLDYNFKTYSPHRKQWRFFNLLTSIEFLKTFPFFLKLDTKDQLILMRHVVVGCSNLHSAYYTLKNKYEDLRQPDGTQRPKKSEPQYSTFAMVFYALMRVGVHYIEYLLLKMIFICNPAIPNLSSNAQYKLEKGRSFYSEMLLVYCLQSLNSSGPTRYVDLIGVIATLEKQQKLLKDLHVCLLAPMLSILPKEFSRSLMYEMIFS